MSDNYGYPLYDLPLSTEPMGFPPPDDGLQTVAEALAVELKDEVVSPPKGSR